MRAHTAAHPPTWRLAARVTRYRLGLYTATVVLLAAVNALLLGIGLVLRWVFDALSGAAPAGLDRLLGADERPAPPQPAARPDAERRPGGRHNPDLLR